MSDAVASPTPEVIPPDPWKVLCAGAFAKFQDASVRDPGVRVMNACDVIFKGLQKSDTKDGVKALLNPLTSEIFATVIPLGKPDYFGLSTPSGEMHIHKILAWKPLSDDGSGGNDYVPIERIIPTVPVV